MTVVISRIRLYLVEFGDLVDFYIGDYWFAITIAHIRAEQLKYWAEIVALFLG